MLGRREQPFPLEAVRDLLGVVRALYAAAVARGAGRPELARIERAGRDLSDAYELAVSSPDDSVGSRAAWARAEKGAAQLGDCVRVYDEARPIVLAACARVRRR